MTKRRSARPSSSPPAPVDTGLTRRAALAGAAGLAGTSLIGGTGAEAQTDSTPEPSLYERLGGFFPIAAVVNRFSDEIITNPKLNENPALKAWNETEAEVRLPGLKFGRTLWIIAMAGGPIDYVGLPLNEAHMEFHLTEEEFAEVGAEIVRALDYYGVPEKEKQELVAAYSTAMEDVVSATA